MDRNKQQQLEVFGIEIEGLKGEELLAKMVAFDGLPKKFFFFFFFFYKKKKKKITLHREFGVGNTSSLRVAATGMAAAGNRSATPKF